jgi:hypothetical protein
MGTKNANFTHFYLIFLLHKTKTFQKKSLLDRLLELLATPLAVGGCP